MKSVRVCSQNIHSGRTGNADYGREYLVLSTQFSVEGRDSDAEDCVRNRRFTSGI
jgi:hypothetical protein